MVSYIYCPHCGAELPADFIEKLLQDACKCSNDDEVCAGSYYPSTRCVCSVCGKFVTTPAPKDD